MEADIKHGVEDPNSVTTLQQPQKDALRMMEHKEGGNPLLSTALKSSTPHNKDERGFVLKIPFVERDDSGFSEATFSSTPLSSLGRTSCSSLASSSSFTDCDISPINSCNRRFSIRRRKQYRHSDPGVSSLAMRLQFLEDNDVLSLHSQNDITKDECFDLSVNTSQPTISSSMKPLKKNFLPDMTELSSRLSQSYSLSSMSDEMEASFQEMSLEENSQSSSSLSSSPAQSTSLHSLARTHSPQDDNSSNLSTVNVENDNIRIISNPGTPCDKDFQLKVFEKQQKSDQCEVCFQDSVQFTSDTPCKAQGDLDARLSINPNFLTFQASGDSSIQKESVILEQKSVSCDTGSLSPSKLSHDLPLNSKGGQRTKPSSSHLAKGPSSPHPSPQTHTSPFNSPADSNLSSWSRHQASISPNPSSQEAFFKSPTKRISETQINNTEISPFKMRKLIFDVEKTKNVASIRKNFTKTDLLLPSDSSLHKSQYHNFSNWVHSQDASFDDPTPSKEPTRTYAQGQRGNDHIADSRNRELSRVIEKFSPPVPSRLIGRRVGLAKCDIIGELTRQNFIGCLGRIFQYLSDIDLASVARVNLLWRAALDYDLGSYHRLERYQLAQRNFKQLLGKENVPGYPKDKTVPSVTRAKGPLDLVQEQAAVAPTPSPSRMQEVNLLWDDSKRTCPKCVGTALYYPAENRATCIRGNCDFVFCTLCFSAFHHPEPCKPLFTSTSKADLAGTRKSKRNLKRL